VTKWRSRFRARIIGGLASSRYGAGIAYKVEQQRSNDDRLRSEKLKAQAQVEWACGNERKSLDMLRQSLLAEPRSTGLWLLYAQRLIENQQAKVAIAALQNSLDVKPTNLLALELYYDVTRTSPAEKRNFRQALDKLAEHAASDPACHRGAIDFAIPFNHRGLLQQLSNSDDDFTRAVMRLEVLEGSRDGDASRQDSVESRESYTATDHLVRAVHALARGRMTGARSELRTVDPSHYPVDAIRRAIRRLAAQQKYGAQSEALRLYLIARPNDSWARNKLHDSEQLQAAVDANASIIRRGITFPPRNSGREYEPDRARALHLLHNSLPETSNGYATRSHGLLSGLVSEGWNIEALTRPGFPFDLPGYSEVETSDTVVVDSVRYSRFTDGRVAKDPVTKYVEHYSAGVLDRARAQRPFVIHGASNHVNGLAAVSAARTAGVPSIYEVRGLWEVTRASRTPGWEDTERYRLMKRLETDAACGADVVLALTGALRDELVERGVEPGKIVVVPNGVDTERFVPLARDIELARELQVQDKTVIGYVGSVLDYEGIGLLVEAAAQMSRHRSDFHLLIVGDGAERRRFEELAMELGVRDLVTFTGRVPHHDVERYYSLIDIAPFPRLPLPVTEMVSPLKPFEAMAMGKAVVASDVRALGEIVRQDDTGLVHLKGSAEDLTSKLEELLDRPELRYRLGEAGRLWVRSERDWRRIAGLVGDVYEEIGGIRNQSVVPPIDSSGGRVR